MAINAKSPRVQANLGMKWLEIRAKKAGLNFPALLQWGIKYGETLFVPVVLDLIAHNYVDALRLAATAGPQALADLLVALGIQQAAALAHPRRF